MNIASLLFASNKRDIWHYSLLFSHPLFNMYNIHAQIDRIYVSNSVCHNIKLIINNILCEQTIPNKPKLATISWDVTCPKNMVTHTDKSIRLWLIMKMLTILLRRCLKYSSTNIVRRFPGIPIMLMPENDMKHNNDKKRIATIMTILKSTHAQKSTVIYK